MPYWYPFDDLAIVSMLVNLHEMGRETHSLQELGTHLRALVQEFRRANVKMDSAMVRLKSFYELPGSILANAFGVEESYLRARWNEIVPALDARGGSPSYLLPSEIYDNPVICKRCAGQGYVMDAHRGAYRICDECNGVGCFEGVI